MPNTQSDIFVKNQFFICIIHKLSLIKKECLTQKVKWGLVKRGRRFLLPIYSLKRHCYKKNKNVYSNLPKRILFTLIILNYFLVISLT